MKSTLTIATLLSVMHTSAVQAVPALDTNNPIALDKQLRSGDLSYTELPVLDESSMTWPMLPGENLNEIAHLFYPNNAYMRRQFVLKTISLSKSVQPKLRPKLRFKEPTLVIIPTLKSLSGKVREAKKEIIKPKMQTLNMTYQLEKVPEALVKEYEELVNKNAFLKQELAKLNEKLIFLQAKLNVLKLEFDKTLGRQSANVANKPLESLPASTANSIATNKVFKNLNKQAEAPKPNENEAQVNAHWFDAHILWYVFGLGALFGLGAFVFKKHRQTVDAKLSFLASKAQESVTELHGLWQPSRQATVQNTQLKTADTKTHQQSDTSNPFKQADSSLSSSLEEAKLLMSINRTSDAIAHLKMAIKSAPKSSINHWLYLLEVFRKLKLKDEFENYAKELHTTFNVLPPIWDETIIPVVTPKSLQEFPHIMEKLYKTWPQDEAYSYLRGLIADNRGGERMGFGKEVVEEIMSLLGLLEVRKQMA